MGAVAEGHGLGTDAVCCDSFSLLPSVQFLAYGICMSYFVIWVTKGPFPKRIKTFHLICVPLGSHHLNRLNIFFFFNSFLGIMYPDTQFGKSDVHGKQLDLES